MTILESTQPCRSSQESNVILITGASSGIGLASAKFLADRGHKVYGMVRSISNTEALDTAVKIAQGNLVKIVASITDETEVNQAVAQILDKEKKIDVLINNAGYALTGTVESCTVQQQMDLFNVNYFGTVRMIQAVLPSMRERKAGRIINVGSICGFAPFAAIENYSASKFALDGLSESMSTSLSPFKVKVIIIEPGGVNTPAAQKQPIGSKDLGKQNPYDEFHKKSDEMNKANLGNGRKPQELAEMIHEIIHEQEPHLRYQFGEFAQKMAEERFKDPTGDSHVKLHTELLQSIGLLPRVNL